MIQKLRCAALVFAFVACLGLAAVYAQEEHSAATPEQHSTATSEQHHAASPHGGSHEGAAEEAGPHDKYKFSPMVQKLAGFTGLSVRKAYWLSMIVNFTVIALLLVFVMRSKLPSWFSTRTEAIQKGMTEARAASEDARRRLGDVEVRLARLDADIAELRAASDKEAAVDEERIRAAAEEDVRKVLQTAEQEIDAASRQARRELKSLAAELAVGLAEKKLQIDPATDRVLVSDFVRQLGKDGK